MASAIVERESGCPPRRRVSHSPAFISATFPEEIRKLADSILNNPTFIEVARNETAVTVTQVVHG